MDDEVWFWQRIVSPHMAGLAAALAARGVSVTYVAEREMSAARAAQGWKAPELGRARLRLAPNAAAIDEAVRAAPAGSIHVCQGLRGNGLVGRARKRLAARGLRQWVVMETVDDEGWRGVLKRLHYRLLIGRWRGRIEGILATGHATPAWLVARGMPEARVFPFAYFLPEAKSPALAEGNGPDRDRPFQFVFVGQLIERKRLDLLIEALALLDNADFSLTVVGTGPLDTALRQMAERRLPGVRWLGQRPIDEIPALLSRADCLVLPSRHDGWGAVVSEALMAGTPAICSDRCGAAGVVQASGAGGAFPSGDVLALRAQLQAAMALGPVNADRRRALSDWARCLGAEAGAAYLADILAFTSKGACTARPDVPWLAQSACTKIEG